MKTSHKIVKFISDHKKASANELTRHLKISSRAVFKHLKKLSEAKIIAKEGMPPKVYYHLNKGLAAKSVPSHTEPLQKVLGEITNILEIKSQVVEKINSNEDIIKELDRSIISLLERNKSLLQGMK